MRLDRWLPALLPWSVGLVALCITGWLWQHEQLSLQRTRKAELDFSVRQTASRIESRIASYEQMLRGVQGLFHASEAVRRNEFDAYIDALLAGADFAGIQFFAFAPKAAQAGADTTTARLAYVAPATASNLKLLGEDPYADPLRRTAMLLAGDSTGLGITPLLPDLFTLDRAAKPGFLMFLPIYAKNRVLDSVAARREALAGWVVAGVRMNELMSSLYGERRPGVEVRIHDGVDLGPQSLMYESDPGRTDARQPRQEVLEYIGVAGHSWTLAVSAGPEFEQRVGGDAVQIIAWSGLGGTLLLVLLTHQLVSGRQRANDLARDMTREVRASEERYRRIVETADEGIWVTDERGRTTFVNPKLAQMLGHQGDEIIGRTQDDFLDRSESAGAADGPAGAAGPRELKFRCKDGATLWASMATTAVLDASGRPAGALAMVTDITTKKQAEAARVALEAQLRESQKMEAIGTLAGGIAHDFNNILAAILGNVALARDAATRDPALQVRLEQIGTAAVRARSLVQQILAFSRRQPHRLISQPLRPVIEESVRLLRPLLPALASLDLRLAEAPMHVMADATQLQQVVMNLCTNAWHALQGRAGRITIGLDAVMLDTETAKRLGLSAGRHAHLWVSDTGSGMDEVTRARAFEPFFTTKPVGHGTGLGLSVVHGIVASHGGAIGLASQPGEGSRFDLYLPLLAAAQTAPLALAAAPDVPGRTGRQVVYVDDDPVMVAMVQALLERAGYRVSCFEDPRDALAALRERPDACDIVVTDYNMPGLSGLDVALELARDRPDLPVVISSGYVTEALCAAATQAGVRQVMQKEYTLEQLPGIVRSVLDAQGGA